jgi:hypothetical protein
MPAVTGFVLRIVASGCFLFLLAGCATTSKPPPPPLVPASAKVVRAEYFTGTPLTGPRLIEPEQFQPEAALRVDVTLIAVERDSAPAMNSLAVQARLILAARGTIPVRAAPRLTRTAGFVEGAEVDPFIASVNRGSLGRTSQLGVLHNALPKGTTLRIETTDSGVPSRIGDTGARHRRLGIQLYFPPPAGATAAPSTAPSSAPSTPASKISATRRPQAQTTAPVTMPAPAEPEIEFAVQLEDYADPDLTADSDIGDEDSPGAKSGHPRTLQQELVILEPRAVGGGYRFAVLLPFHFRDASNRGVVAIFHVKQGSASDASHQDACKVAKDELEKSYSSLIEQRKRTTTPDSSTVADALAALARPDRQRATLVFLSHWCGAQICEDVALSADVPTLARLTQKVVAAIGTPPQERGPIAWPMDREALDLLAKMQSDSQLTPELTAVLVDRTGEVGRHASAMEEVLRDLPGPEDLTARLIAVNRDYLKDNSPASSARAYEWLRVRGQAPTDFDPMASVKDRRAAMKKSATRPAGR